LSSKNVSSQAISFAIPSGPSNLVLSSADYTASLVYELENPPPLRLLAIGFAVSFQMKLESLILKCRYEEKVISFPFSEGTV